MFRKMRRFKQELSKEECIDILKTAPRGVLAIYGEDGYPYAFPMNFIYYEGKMYFHCAKAGHKTDALTADNRVSFCVMNEGFRKEGDWALNISSVILFGRIIPLDTNEETLTVARALAMKYFPTEQEAEKELQNSSKRVQLLELEIDHMSGKLVKES